MGSQPSTVDSGPVPPLAEPKPKTVDPRLPFDNYRQFYSLKNWWKQVMRRRDETAKENFLRLLNAHPEYKDFYPGLGAISSESELLEDTTFENSANNIFHGLDEVMQNLEENTDASIAQLKEIGNMYKSKGFPLDFFKHMEESYLNAVKITLQDRYTEKCEDCFKRLYGFMLKQISDAYNG